MEPYLMNNFIENPVNTTKDILTALNILTAKEIAAKLKHLNIKGERKSAFSCPLSAYLENRTGVHHTITDNGYYIYDRAHGIIHGELPKSVAKFVKKFDKGKYPELIK